MTLGKNGRVVWPLLAMLPLAACDEATLSALSQGLSQMGQMNGAQLPTPPAFGGGTDARYFPPVAVSGASAGTYYANYYERSCAGQRVVYPAANACQDALAKIQGASVVAQPRPASPAAPARTMAPVAAHNAAPPAAPAVATIAPKPAPTAKPDMPAKPVAVQPVYHPAYTDKSDWRAGSGGAALYYVTITNTGDENLQCMISLKALRNNVGYAVASTSLQSQYSDERAVFVYKGRSNGNGWEALVPGSPGYTVNCVGKPG